MKLTVEKDSPISKSNSIVAFIDILGFREIIKANEKSKNDAVIFELQNAFNQAVKKTIFINNILLNGMKELEDDEFLKKINHRQFSDNIYFSYDYSEDNSDYEFAFFVMATMAANYQRIMLSKGFYVRGGIADGKVYFDENMIFSNALVKAYEIESKVAKYPRIVIDEQVLKKLKRLDRKNILKKIFPELVVKDWTDLAFLNPFKFTDTIFRMFSEIPEAEEEIENLVTQIPELLTEVKKLDPDILDHEFIEIVAGNVTKNLKKFKRNKDVLEKFIWLNEFINWQKQNKSNLEFKYL